MITLKLFRQDDPFREIDTRSLRDGALTIGRDPAAQWHILDPDCELSRQHCVLAYREGRISVKDTSTNGVYLGADRRRAPRDEFVPLGPRDSVQFGPYMLLMEYASNEVDGTRS